MKYQKVQWGDNSISSAPDWLVKEIRKEIDPSLKILKEIEIEKGQQIPEDFLPVRANYKPVPILDTRHCNAREKKEKWLEMRRSGIGGSENAVARGFGKYQSNVSLYWDKIRSKAYQPLDTSSNWEVLEYGHLMEPWIRKVFESLKRKKTKEVPVMYRHPLFPFMLADIDGIVIEPDNGISIIECKTTNPKNLRDWKDGKAPIQYVAQAMHYMAVTNIDKVYLVCAYGNTRKDIIIREIRRDYIHEKHMIQQLSQFWEKVLIKEEPSPISNVYGSAVYTDFQKIKGRRFRQVRLNYDQNAGFIEKLTSLQNEIQSKSKDLEIKQDELKRLKAILLQQLEEDGQMFSKGTITDYKHGLKYVISIGNPVEKEVIPAEAQQLLKENNPEIFNAYKRKTIRMPRVSVKTYEFTDRGDD